MGCGSRLADNRLLHQQCRFVSTFAQPHFPLKQKSFRFNKQVPIVLRLGALQQTHLLLLPDEPARSLRLLFRLRKRVHCHTTNFRE